MRKAIIIGRHQLTGAENLNVLDQRNIMFPATSEECIPMLTELISECNESDAWLVFQAMPGQVSAALLNWRGVPARCGVIVSVPGDRPEAQKRSFTDIDGSVENAARFSNPRANVRAIGGGCVEIQVDPPMRFEFSHIEWFAV